MTKKEKEIEEFLLTPIQVGECVSFTVDKLHKSGEIISIDQKNNTFCTNRNTCSCSYQNISLNVITQRATINKIGVNPIKEETVRIHALDFALESIIGLLNLDNEKELDVIGGIEVLEVNWDPFVYANGEKKYYQRGFVWSLEDNQNLIHSIYENIKCGKVLIRKRSWEEVEKIQNTGELELAFKDIIDGKQRLNALKLFINNEFPDEFGNYWKDLSRLAQSRFENKQAFTFCTLDGATDDQILEQFLKLNFCGMPQSKKHIDYVRSLRNKTI